MSVCEGRVCVGSRPTEGAPTPRNADGVPPAGERGDRLTFLEFAEQRRCQLRTVTAWGGEGRGEEAGAPEEEKEAGGETQARISRRPGLRRQAAYAC